MIKQLLLVLLGILAIICARAAFIPGQFRVERSTMINAAPERVFGLINDFHEFGLWSPLERLDPNMSRSITGAPAGKGAIYEWSGNTEAGAGRMEIVESTPATRIVMKLDVTAPFQSQSTAEFLITRDKNATRVTSTVYGPSPFFSKFIQVFKSVDQRIGPDVERGLANMKAAAEKS